MPAYLIVEVETTDEALMAEYRKHTPGAIAKFGGKFIVRGGKTRTVEGGWTPSRLVMIEFPDLASAWAWYRSPAYQAIVQLRLNNSTGSCILVDGVSAEHRATDILDG